MDEKTYILGNDNNSLIPALLNNANSMGGNGWWIIILLMALWGKNGFGGGDVNPIISQLGNDSGRDMIMQAINGNQQAINTLCQTLNCDANSLLIGLNEVRAAITSGNAAITSQMGSSCCDIKNAITTQGFENRIANAEQTATLAGKIDYQTSAINDKFCALEMREMQNKINTLQETNTQLQNSISNANQTAQIQAYVNTLIAPLQNTVNEIKQAVPTTVTLPYSPVTAVPTAALYNYNQYGTLWS